MLNLIAKFFKPKTIHDACQKGDLNSVKYFLNSGSNINKKSKEGFTPINISIASEHNEITELLIKNGADLNTFCFEWSPLILAICYENEQLVNLIINNGANVNLADEDNITPLHRAANGESLYIVKLLINRGANINAIDSSGFTPLDNCSDMELEGDVAKIAIYLRQNGAKLSKEL